MIEAVARAIGRPVSRETFTRLEHFVSLLLEENRHQNLISPGSVKDAWSRHIVDSAQLVRFSPHEGASWVDVGSGAGLPGIVIACLHNGPVTLIEPRRLRAEFLRRVCDSLQLNASVYCGRAQSFAGKFDVISARAVAPLPRLLEISHHLSTANTVWVLPKGQSAERELAQAEQAWQGRFHVERSVTDEDSRIIVGTEVRARR